MKDKKMIVTIVALILVALIIFFVLGFLRKGPQPQPGNQPGPNAVQPSR